jgi:ribonuclease HII
MVEGQRAAMRACTLELLCLFECLATHTGHSLEAGLDEAGRGCLAGPLFCTARLNLTFNDPNSHGQTARSASPIICAEAGLAVAKPSVLEIEHHIAQASYLP